MIRKVLKPMPVNFAWYVGKMSTYRDWYDLVWYAANHPELHLSHLEQRIRQSGDWKGNKPLDPAPFQKRLSEVIDALDVNQARREVASFVRHPQALEVWSQEFFKDVAGRIRVV
jgi:hypothetical protein